MIKKFTFILLLLGYVACTYAQINQTNHIIIIDKTGSMQGENGALNIWIEVKSAIKEYVNSIEMGDRITIYTYATDVSTPKIFTISGVNDKEEICSFIDSLKADGRNTCTYKTLNKVLNEYNVSQVFKANLIYLYTDGLNNCSGYTMQEIADIFKAKRDDYDYLYYISLGYDIPIDVQAVAQKDGNIIPQKVADPQNKDNIIPKSINVSEDLLVFDFTDQIEVEKLVPIEITGGSMLANTILHCEIIDADSDDIELVTEQTIIENDHVEIKMRMNENVYSNDEKLMKLKFSTTDSNMSLGNSTISIKIIPPKKRTAKITFK